jgi:hypothetical protein
MRFLRAFRFYPVRSQWAFCASLNLIFYRGGKCGGIGQSRGIAQCPWAAQGIGGVSGFCEAKSPQPPPKGGAGAKRRPAKPDRALF